MEACERVDRTRMRMATALRFTRTLINEAEPAGLLNLHGRVKTQMQQLHNAAIRPEDVQVQLKFEWNPARFEEALDNCYGYFLANQQQQQQQQQLQLQLQNNHTNRSSSSNGSSGGIPSKPVSSLGLPTPSSTPCPPSPTHSSPMEPLVGQMGHGSSMGGFMMPNDLSHSVHVLNSMADITSNGAADLSAAMNLSSLANYNSINMSSMRNLEHHQQQQHQQRLHQHQLNNHVLHHPQHQLQQQQQHHHQQQQQQHHGVDSGLGSGSMTSIQEYNLQRLASLVGKSCATADEGPNPTSHHQHHHHQQQQQQQQQKQVQRHSNVAPSGNPSNAQMIAHRQSSPPFTLADLLSGDHGNMSSHALNNIQALAKLGSQSNPHLFLFCFVLFYIISLLFFLFYFKYYLQM